MRALRGQAPTAEEREPPTGSDPSGQRAQVLAHRGKGLTARTREPVVVLGLQAAAALAVAAALALIASGGAAKAALLGGSVVVLPNAYLALATMRRLPPLDERTAVREGMALLVRWVVKVALTIGLMVWAIATAGLDGLGFFLGLGAASLAPLATPWVGATECARMRAECPDAGRMSGR